jgi:hypothetical protein
MTKVTCPDCGNEYQSSGLGTHISKSDCEYPDFTEHQKEVLTGVLMGDGTVVRNNGNPDFRIKMINKDYLLHLKDIFGSLATEVSLERVDEDDNHNDIYQLRLRSNPNIQQFADWYSTGKKVFPDDIELTPTVLRHWYVCDGTLYERSTVSHHFSICAKNEGENIEKLKSYFIEQGLPEPNTPSYGKFKFYAEGTQEIFDYIGWNPVPGFEYKWDLMNRDFNQKQEAEL